MKNASVIAGIMALLMACSTTKPPTQTLSQTEAAINQAEQVGAEDYAPLEIREARKKLQKAQDLSDEEKYEEAERVAQRAMIDAEYAQIKSLSSKAQKAVFEMKESIRALQEEIQKNIDKNSQGQS